MRTTVLLNPGALSIRERKGADLSGGAARPQEQERRRARFAALAPFVGRRASGIPVLDLSESFV